MLACCNSLKTLDNQRQLYMEDYKFIALMGDKTADFSVNVTSQNLRAFADYLIEKAKEILKKEDQEPKESVVEEKTMLTRYETCKYLDVCPSTLWAWAKPEVRYLVPVKQGGRVMYKKADVDRVKFGRLKDKKDE